MAPRAYLAAVLAMAIVGGACSNAPAADVAEQAGGATLATSPSPDLTSTTPAATPSSSPSAEAAAPRADRQRTVSPPPAAPPTTVDTPDWLGSRVLEPGPTGFPPPQPTPPELFPRALGTDDLLPPPADTAFSFAAGPVPAEVAQRSTWHDGCPVTLDDLRYATVTFHGFDGQPHTGELLLHADAVDAVRSLFRVMWEIEFPLEAVAIATPADLDAPPTGDGNVTGAFVCRATRGSGRWSEHAYGRALDINPFHNPYDRQRPEGRVVLPELATAYTDRTLDLPGMLHADSPVVTAARGAGWHWGGDYTSLLDPMHLSATGR